MSVGGDACPAVGSADPIGCTVSDSVMRPNSREAFLGGLGLKVEIIDDGPRGHRGTA